MFGGGQGLTILCISVSVSYIILLCLSSCRCDSVTNSCQPDPCQNNASCVDLTGDYQCNCTGNFTGKDCDVKVGNIYTYTSE